MVESLSILICMVPLPDWLQEHLQPLLVNSKIIIQSQPPKQGLYLIYDDGGLGLARSGDKGVVRVDFVQGKLRHRRLFGGGELIARAVQVKNQPLVWDATGGLGRDAFVLASLALDVVVFEHNFIIYLLLKDGLIRAATDVHAAEITQHIQLHYGSILTLPQKQQLYPLPDVVYLDPMYPQKQKSAAVKKEMAYFHQLLGNADLENDKALLATAQKLAQKRVVVKRPSNGIFLADNQPAFQYQGKTTRFDGYLPKH
ncbi:MAG: class I SAM-dependent methyltransferase [Snodgrassella sp.]|nr:class I SAM-dependent methyltransferase [Snodgrassella sp.]